MKTKYHRHDVEIVRQSWASFPNTIFDRTADFGAIFGGLDSEPLQIGVNNFSYTKSGPKILYSTPIFKDAYVVAVAKNHTDINSFRIYRKDHRGGCKYGICHRTAGL